MLTKQKQQANQRPNARGMSLARLPFFTGTSGQKLLSSFSTCEDRDHKKKNLQKYFFLYKRLRTSSEACPQAGPCSRQKLLTFFVFIAKAHPKPPFGNPRAFQPPKQNIIIFLVFLFYIASHSMYIFDALSLIIESSAAMSDNDGLLLEVNWP